jgi:hypothetical protein
MLAILFLISQCFIFQNSIVTALPEDNFIAVSVSDVYKLRGETTTIQVLTASSSFRLEIVDPDGTAVYDAIRSNNMTFAVPSLAVYGTYTIKASTVFGSATTLVDVLDITGWSIASFPYSRTWKNMEYTFFSNGTIRCLQLSTGEVMAIDLGELRTLAQSTGLSVSATSNSMMFRTRFSKNAVVVDLAFAFVHTGLKFIVNGTLDRARAFTFDLPQANLKSSVDSVRQGGIVFDYSDLRKTAHAFSYSNGRLTISLPKTFSFDPSIFSSGYETGDFSEFTGVVSSPTINTTTVYNGSYSAHSDAANEYAYKSGLNSATMNVQCQAYPLVNSTVGDLLGPIAIRAEGGILLAYVDRAGDKLRLSGVGIGEHTSATAFPNATWSLVELGLIVANGTGEAHVYLNGVEVVDLAHTNLDNDGSGNADWACFGVRSATAGWGMFIDNCLADDSYIGGGDSTAPTYSGLSASSTVAGASCQLNSTWTDETGLATTGGYIIGHNNTGTPTNSTWTAFTSNPNTTSTTITLNSTVGNVVQWQVWANDTSNNWNTTGLQNITLTDGTVPSFTSITSSLTLAGSSTTLSVNITDDVAVSFLIWSTNINGTWLNGTTTAFAANPVTTALILPIGIGTNFYAKVYANDTSNNWAVSVQENFTTTAVYISLQARDKDGLNLPRAVTFAGTLPNGSTYSITSSTAGLYSLQCTNGSLTVAVTWQTHLVKSSSTIAVTANASSNLNTNIARLNYTSTQYVLVSINGTSLNTPSYTVLGGWKIDNIGGSGQKPLVVDQANWVKTSNPLAVKIAGNSYDSLNWVLASNILTFPTVDFVAYSEPTVELVYEVSESPSGSSGSSDSVPITTTPSNTSPLGANDFQIGNLELGTIQPNSTVAATLHLRYSGSSYTFQEFYLSDPFYSWLVQDSLSLETYVLTNPTESTADVTFTFNIPADVLVQNFNGEISFTVLDAFGTSHTSNALVSASVEGASVGFDFGSLLKDNLWLTALIVAIVIAVLALIVTKTRRH